MIALLLSALLSPAPQDLAGLAPERQAFDQGALEVDAKVFHDVDAAGDLWARGARWKMRFGAQGAIFLPLFGPGQERHHPLALSPASVRLGTLELLFERTAAPLRDGDRVSFDRGPLREVYDLASEGVEQSFVFPVVPRGGDLSLVLETGSDLDGGQDAEGGVELRHPLGRLAYSQAVAVDGLGRRLPLETRLAGSALEIRVPSAFLALAQAPLLIDPLLSVTELEGSTYVDWNPDVSFDATELRWLVVWERVVTVKDSDVAYKLLDDAGAVISGGYLNLDAERWINPVVANLSSKNMFYVAAEVPAVSGTSAIKGRALSAAAAAGSSGGTVYQLSQGKSWPVGLPQPPVHSHSPMVGGDPSPDVAHGTFCVVWWEQVGSISGIRFRRVDGKGIPLGAQAALLSAGGSVGYYPAISASNDAAEWTVAYSQQTSGGERLVLARIGWDGTITQAPAVLATGVSGRLRVSPAAGGKVMVGALDLYGNLRLIALQGTAVLDQELFIYHGFELGGMLRDFDLAVDGQRFVLGYNSSGYAGLATLMLEPLASQIATLEHVIADWILDSKWEGGLETRHEAGGASGKGLQTWATNWPSYPYDPDVWTAFYQPQ
jgi:hypothetical protein